MNVFDEKSNLGPVTKMYFKNWKLIAFTVIGCAVFAGVASSMLTPRYKAKTVFFIPLNISYDLVVENPQFGFDVEADRLLQILNSEQLKDSVSNKFNLTNYFEIDTSDFDWKNTLSEKYNRRIFFSRTNVMSIVIEAETHDPCFSAEIVKYILDLSQRMRERMLKTNCFLAVESFKRVYLDKKIEIDSLSSRIIALRKSLPGGSIALVNSQLLSDKSNSSSVNPSAAVELEVLTQKHINEYKRLDELKGKYENALNIANRPIPKFYMLDEPTPIYKKTFPMTTFNITIAFLGSLFFMLVGLYLLYVVKSFKKQELSH